MSLWRSRSRSPRPGLARPEGLSDKPWLETLLGQLADDIDADGDDEAHHDWERQIRDAADLVRRGKPWGLDIFLSLFEPVGRPFDQPYPIPNPFTEQPFARTSTCAEAQRLASELRQELDRGQSD